MPNKPSRKPLELKISTVVAVAAVLGDTDHAKLSASLAKITGGTPDYFEDEFTLLDLGHLSPEPEPGSIDWSALISLFRSHRLNPVAVRNPPAALEDELRAQGLAIDRMEQPRSVETTPAEAAVPAAAETGTSPESASSSRSSSASATAPEPAASAAAADAAKPLATPAAAPAASAMVIDTPVRSGQRVYARGTDLIVTATVNPGAEVIADGSIHVYAPLRGRALAGASGDAGARIFSLAMSAELVSIAGVYRTFDEGWPKELSDKPVQVVLQNEKLETRAIPLK